MLLASEGLKQGTTLLLAIALVRLIDQGAFGTYRQALLVFMTLFGLASLNLAGSLFYFIPKLGPERRRQLVSQTFLITCVTSVVVAGVMLLGAETIAAFFDNPELAPLVRILAIYPLSEGILALVPSFMISLDRAIRAGVYGAVAAVARAGAVLGLVVAGYDLAAVLWATVGVSVAVAGVGAVDMIRLSPGKGLQPDRDLIRQLLGYSLPLWLTSVVGVLNIQYDKILISGYFDPAVYAIYSCGAMEVPLVALVTLSLSNAIMPNLVASCSEGNKRDALSTWHEAGRKASFVLIPVFAFLMAVAPDFIELLYGPDYARAVWPFAVYLGVLPLKVVVYSTMLRALGDTRPIAVAALVGLVVNVALSTALVYAGNGSLLSFVGPSIGTLIAAFSMGGLQLLRIMRQTEVPFRSVLRWRELGLVLLTSAAVAFAVWLLPLADLPIAVRLAVRGAAFVAALGLILWHANVLNDEEKGMVRGVWSLGR